MAPNVRSMATSVSSQPSLRTRTSACQKPIRINTVGTTPNVRRICPARRVGSSCVTFGNTHPPYPSNQVLA